MLTEGMRSWMAITYDEIDNNIQSGRIGNYAYGYINDKGLMILEATEVFWLTKNILPNQKVLTVFVRFVKNRNIFHITSDIFHNELHR